MSLSYLNIGLLVRVARFFKFIWGRFLNIAEYNTTDISGVKTDSNAPAEQIYSIDGKRRDSIRRGLNIVRSHSGTKKVIVE